MLVHSSLDEGACMERNLLRIQNLFDDDWQWLDIRETSHANIRGASGTEFIDVSLLKDIQFGSWWLFIRHAFPNNGSFRFFLFPFFLGLFLAGFVRRRLRHLVSNDHEFFVLNLVRILRNPNNLFG